MSLRRSLRRVSTAEVLNMGRYVSLVESSNRWRKGGKGNGRESVLSMLATYTQVDNGSRLRLRYSETL